MVLKTFFMGIIGGFLAIFLEKGFKFATPFLKENLISLLISIFIGGALIEEYVKYLIVKKSTFKSPELDEPVDIMIYMIISALGFASLENILILTNYHPLLDTAKTMEIISCRFISATFLHALCSAFLGYFLIISFNKSKKGFFIIGLFLATLFHGLYNFSMMKIEGLEKFIIPIIILLGLALFVSYAFKKAKRLKHKCNIKV